jgi:hypothetical protein
MASVTLYEELLALFRQFAEQGREAQAGATVIDVWRKTLNGDDTVILRTLALLRITLKRGADQIDCSPNIDREDKSIALDAIRALDDVINPDLYNTSFGNVADHVSPGKITMLMLLASSLQTEYPEPTLSADDVSRISGAIDELGGTVRASNYLDTVLKNRLLGHITYMNWAVRNINLTGAEAVYTAFGPPLLFLRQEINGRADGADESMEPKKQVYERMEELFQRIADGMSRSA